MILTGELRNMNNSSIGLNALTNVHFILDPSLLNRTLSPTGLPCIQIFTFLVADTSRQSNNEEEITLYVCRQSPPRISTSSTVGVLFIIAASCCMAHTAVPQSIEVAAYSARYTSDRLIKWCRMMMQHYSSSCYSPRLLCRTYLVCYYLILCSRLEWL